MGVARRVNSEKGKQGFQRSTAGKQAPKNVRATSIRVTEAQLRARRREIVASLPEGEEVLRAKVKYFAALTNREWSAAAELQEIDFLLGEDS